jgi:hypothetical protein
MRHTPEFNLPSVAQAPVVDSTNAGPRVLRDTLAPLLETRATMLATAGAAVVLTMVAFHAGPLWRDEVNTINMAEMPTLGDLWKNLPFESFPPLWPLILRALSLLGLTQSDLGIRLIGLVVGFSFLACLWCCARSVTGRAPTLSAAFLCTSPVVLNIVGANRAYGLAMCLLVLVFTSVWNLLQRVSMSRIGLACLWSLLFAQSLYYSIFFLGAILLAATAVAVCRGRWRMLWILALIGGIAAVSLVPYLPVVRYGDPYLPINQTTFDFWSLWAKITEAVSTHSSAQFPGQAGVELWFWLALAMAGFTSALLLQVRRVLTPSTPGLESPQGGNPARSADLALFTGVSVLAGIGCYAVFLLHIRFPTHSWYYTLAMTLCAISMDIVLSGSSSNRATWGVLRTGVLVFMVAWGASATWDEARVRRSNVDQIALTLERCAAPEDLILVHSSYEGISFDRYYKGRNRWLTIPPIESHKVHRNDLLWRSLHEPNPMSSALAAIRTTIQNGGKVWIVGHLPSIPPGPLSPAPNPERLPTKWWLPPYADYWAKQAVAELRAGGRTPELIPISLEQPVNRLENLPLWRF